MTKTEKEFKRGKNVIQNPLTITDIYKFYSSKHENSPSLSIDYKTFRAICNDANKIISKAIIDDGKLFKVPYRLGIIRIKKRQISFDNLKPDFGLYMKSNGEHKNKFLNEHTGNYYVRFFWTKMRDTIVKNKTPYSFIPTRYNKRYLASILKRDGILQVNKYFD